MQKHNWNQEKIKEANSNWQSYTKEEQEDILKEIEEVFKELAKLKDRDVESKEEELLETQIKKLEDKKDEVQKNS